MRREIGKEGRKCAHTVLYNISCIGNISCMKKIGGYQ